LSGQDKKRRLPSGGKSHGTPRGPQQSGPHSPLCGAPLTPAAPYQTKNVFFACSCSAKHTRRLFRIAQRIAFGALRVVRTTLGAAFGLRPPLDVLSPIVGRMWRQPTRLRAHSNPTGPCPPPKSGGLAEWAQGHSATHYPQTLPSLRPAPRIGAFHPPPLQSEHFDNLSRGFARQAKPNMKLKTFELETLLPLYIPPSLIIDPRPFSDSSQ